MPYSFSLSVLECWLSPCKGCFLNNNPGSIICHFHQVPALYSYTFGNVNHLYKTVRAVSLQQHRNRKPSIHSGEHVQTGSHPACAGSGESYLWGMPVVWAVACSPDSSQSFRYQFISTSRTRASCRALSWVCPEGPRLLSFPFSAAFLGDLSLLPTENPDSFLNLEFSSEIWPPAAPVRAASILGVWVCLSEKTWSHCHQSNLNWFFCFCLPLLSCPPASP